MVKLYRFMNSCSALSYPLGRSQPTVKTTGWVEANLQLLLCSSGRACSHELPPQQISAALHRCLTGAGSEKKTLARKDGKK